MNRAARRRLRSQQRTLTTGSPQPQEPQQAVPQTPQPYSIPYRAYVQRIWELGRRWITGMIGLLVSGGTLFVLFSELSPKLSASSTVLDPSNAFSARFQITNNGRLSINDAAIICRFVDVHFETIRFRGSAFMQESDFWPSIDPGETVTLPCRYRKQMIDKPLSSADIHVVIEFRPSWWPTRVSQHFRFIALKAENGSWLWEAQPLSK